MITAISRFIFGRSNIADLALCDFVTEKRQWIQLKNQSKMAVFAWWNFD